MCWWIVVWLAYRTQSAESHNDQCCVLGRLLFLIFNNDLDLNFHHHYHSGLVSDVRSHSRECAPGSSVLSLMQDRGWTDTGLPPPFSARYVSDDLDAASSSWDCVIFSSVLSSPTILRLSTQSRTTQIPWNCRQTSINTLYQWARSWQMSSNISKCKVMHLGRRNVGFQYCMNGQ